MKPISFLILPAQTNGKSVCSMNKITFLVHIICFLIAINGNGQSLETLFSKDTLALQPNVQQTVPVVLKNSAAFEVDARVVVQVPFGWSVYHDIPENQTFKPTSERKFFILLKPGYRSPPGTYSLRIRTTTALETQETILEMNLPKISSFKATVLSYPESISSNQEGYVKYLLQNLGNVSDTLYIKETNAAMTDGFDRTWPLLPGEQVTIELPFIVPEKGLGKQQFITQTLFASAFSGETVKVKKSFSVYHTTLKASGDDLYFPITAGISYIGTDDGDTPTEDRFQFELSGKGALNLEKKRYVEFLFRGPNTINQPRFGNYDQYSVAYSTPNTLIKLGDYGLGLHTLSLQNRWVRGGYAKTVLNKKYTFTGFYGEPRFFKLTKKILGGSFQHEISGNFSYYVEALKKEEFFKSEFREGWLATSGTHLRISDFRLDSQVSYSYTDGNNGLGVEVKPEYSGKTAQVSIEYLYASKNFFGFYTDSEILNARTYTNLGRFWRLGFGYNLSRYNRQREDFEIGSQPRSEQTYADLSWKRLKGPSVHFRLYQRTYADNAENPIFDYDETGVRTTFAYKFPSWQVSLQNIIAGTINHLAPEANNSQTTYDTNLSLFFPFKKISMQFFGQHLNTNRFNNEDGRNQSYWYYGTTLNLNGARLNGSLFWRNSYAKDELYRNQNFFNANLTYTISPQDVAGFNGGYNVYPEPYDKTELFFNLFYKHTFHIYRGKNKGYAISGSIENLENDPFEKGGIRFRINQQDVSTDEQGIFSVENLRSESVTVNIDKNTIPKGYLVKTKLPQIIRGMPGTTIPFSVSFVKEGTLEGTLTIKRAERSTLNNKSPRMFLKLFNEDVAYFAEVSPSLNYGFYHVLPGVYQLEIINDLSRDNLYIETLENTISIAPGENVLSNIYLRETERKIKFVKIKK